MMQQLVHCTWEQKLLPQLSLTPAALNTQHDENGCCSIMVTSLISVAQFLFLLLWKGEKPPQQYWDLCKNILNEGYNSFGCGGEQQAFLTFPEGSNKHSIAGLSHSLLPWWMRLEYVIGECEVFVVIILLVSCCHTQFQCVWCYKLYYYISKTKVFICMHVLFSANIHKISIKCRIIRNKIWLCRRGKKHSGLIGSLLNQIAFQ